MSHKHKEPKTSKKLEGNLKFKIGVSGHSESIFHSHAFKNKGKASSHSAISVPRGQPRQKVSFIPLEQGQPSAAQADDLPSHRSSHSTSPPQPKPPDPKFLGKGVRLSSSLTIPGVSPRPSHGAAFTSVKALKALAREAHHGLTDAEVQMLVEGVDFHSDPSQ